MMSAEGGVQPKEYLSKYIAERVRNVSGTWLGATFGCCECHNHKFDPFLAKDFYSLEAFFADIEEQRALLGGRSGRELGTRASNFRRPHRKPSGTRLGEAKWPPPKSRSTRRPAELDSGPENLGEGEARKTSCRRSRSVLAVPRQSGRTPSVRSWPPITARSRRPSNRQRKKLAELEQAAAHLKRQIPSTLITVAVTPRTIRLLHRGNWMDESGQVMHAGLSGGPLACQASRGPADAGRFRPVADVGRESADGPHLRQPACGNWRLAPGLSPQVDDLGAQGEWPSHPRLLDWLAGQFIDSGWNVKHVVKLIVMSGTYRQSSQVTPELREADPDNRWLARQGRFRLDAEMVRDNALKISGLLVERIGGPSVKPYQPPGYWSHLNFPPREWENGSGPQLYRRSLYTHWQRQYLHPAMLAFDAPGREECTADRPRSNTPLQSLVLMNDPEFVESARAFGEQILEHGGATTGTTAGLGLPPGFVADLRETSESAVLTRLLERPPGGIPAGSQGGRRTGGDRRAPASPVQINPCRAGSLDERLPHDPQPARNDHPQLRHAMTLPPRIGRRTFVWNTGVSLGSMALASMMPRTKSAQAAIDGATAAAGPECSASRSFRRGPSGSSGSTWPAA